MEANHVLLSWPFGVVLPGRGHVAPLIESGPRQRRQKEKLRDPQMVGEKTGCPEGRLHPPPLSPLVTAAAAPLAAEVALTTWTPS
jgi:hypothetical protein